MIFKTTYMSSSIYLIKEKNEYRLDAFPHQTFETVEIKNYFQLLEKITSLGPNAVILRKIYRNKKSYVDFKAYTAIQAQNDFKYWQSWFILEPC